MLFDFLKKDVIPVNMSKIRAIAPPPSELDKVRMAVDILNKIGVEYKISFKGFTYECSKE